MQQEIEMPHPWRYEQHVHCAQRAEWSGSAPYERAQHLQHRIDAIKHRRYEVAAGATDPVTRVQQYLGDPTAGVAIPRPTARPRTAVPVAPLPTPSHKTPA